MSYKISRNILSSQPLLRYSPQLAKLRSKQESALFSAAEGVTPPESLRQGSSQSCPPKTAYDRQSGERRNLYSATEGAR